MEVPAQPRKAEVILKAPMRLPISEKGLKIRYGRQPLDFDFQVLSKEPSSVEFEFI